MSYPSGEAPLRTSWVVSKSPGLHSLLLLLILLKKMVWVNGRLWKRLQDLSIVGEKGNVQLLGKGGVMGVVG